MLYCLRDIEFFGAVLKLDIKKMRSVLSEHNCKKMRNVILPFIFILFYAALGIADSILVEAENFDNKGSWVIDQQFIEQMGSSYLLAHGLGQPVEDAVTTVTFPSPGTYKMWVRTKNWVPGSWDAPGRFQVLINGDAVRTTFGTIAEWTWQDGGTIHVTDLQVQIKLRDLTGFEGRCDAIYFNTNTVIRPRDFDPANPQTNRQWRNHLRGLPNTPPDGGRFDVVIVGGGISGCAAALAAERQGMQVALIHDRPLLGGNASNEIRVHTEGIHGKGSEILSQIDTDHYPNGNAAAIDDQKKRESAMDSADGITIFRSHRAYDVQMKGKQIVSVDACSVTSGKSVRIRSNLFIDCTGDGWIGYWAGADYRYGRESKNEYDESWDQHGDLWSPTVPDNRVMGSSLLWYSSVEPTTSPFPAVPWAMDVAQKHSATAGEWFWEYSNNEKHMIHDAEDIRDHMFRAIYGSFFNAKQSPSNASRKLDWMGYLSGKRESRRLMGDYIYKQSDAISGMEFDDTVVEEKRVIDVHYQRSLVGESQDFLSTALFLKVPKYYIPFRCLYSRNIDNLMMAGRCFSCTHVGLGGPRVMNTCGQMGIATGYAASLCVMHDTNPRGVYKNHIQELRTLIGYPVPVSDKTSNMIDFSTLLRPVPTSAKFIDEDYYIWGASMVKDKQGTCHLFCSRWPRNLHHNAWVTHSEIAHAISDDPLGPYKHIGVALPQRGARYWDGLCTHNPTVHEFDGKYYLYYMGNTGDGKASRSLNMIHRNNQRIGVAVADHPNGPWRRFDSPLIDVSPDDDAPDALVANNPSICRRPDGRFLLIYKAVGKKRPLPYGGPVVHLAATSSSPTGPFTKHDGIIFTKPGDPFPAEDPFIWHQGGRYRAIVKDMKGAFTHAGPSLAMFDSDDGLNWRPAENPLVSKLQIQWEDGAVQKVAHLERPQIFCENGIPKVLFCAVDSNRGHAFNVHIPLVSEEVHPLEKSKPTVDFTKLIPSTLPRSIIYRQEGYLLWDPSVIRSDDGMYHLFYARWLEKYGHRGWCTHAEIARATSDNAVGPYTFQSVVLPARGVDHWDGHSVYNTCIAKIDKKYYLYYTGNRGTVKWAADRVSPNKEWWVHRNNQRIGVAVADSPGGPWQRFDKPLLDVGTGFGHTIINVPNLLVKPDGGYRLYYKTLAEGSGNFGGGVFHFGADSNSPLGPFTPHLEPVVNKNKLMPEVKHRFDFHIDDHFEWIQNGRYYAIVKDHDAPFLTEHGRSLILFESADGRRWLPSKQSLVKTFSITWNDGNTSDYDRLEMPKLLFEQGRPTVLSLAAKIKSSDESYIVNIPLANTDGLNQSSSKIQLNVGSKDTLPLPSLKTENPGAGKMVKVTAPEYAGTNVFHTLYLPESWNPNWRETQERLPIIFEYTGNKYAPCRSTGEVEDACLGYGLSGGKYIWVSLPYINKSHTDNEVTWWGDTASTVQYAKTNVPRMIEAYGGDKNAIFLCGFSRGAIAVNYIGLHDDDIAKLWTAFIAHDHFDGVQEWRGRIWGSPLEVYREAAAKRLLRVNGRPYMVRVNEGSSDTETFIKSVLSDHRNFYFYEIDMNEIFPTIPSELVIHSHNDRWLLPPSIYRDNAWQWMNEVVKQGQ